MANQRQLRPLNLWVDLFALVVLGLVGTLVVVLIGIVLLGGRGMSGSLLPNDGSLQYDIFRDLLPYILGIPTFILTLFSVIGYGAYRIIKSDLEKKVETAVVGQFLRRFYSSLSNTYLALSYLAWRACTTDSAVSYAKYAVGEDLPQTQEGWEERHKKAILQAKNNLAWLLAEMHLRDKKPKDGNKARDLAEEVYKAFQAGKEGYNYSAWVGNYYFVRACFADSLEVRKKIKEDAEKELANVRERTLKPEDIEFIKGIRDAILDEEKTRTLLLITANYVKKSEDP